MLSSSERQRVGLEAALHLLSIGANVTVGAQAVRAHWDELNDPPVGPRLPPRTKGWYNWRFDAMDRQSRETYRALKEACAELGLGTPIETERMIQALVRAAKGQRY